MIGYDFSLFSDSEDCLQIPPEGIYRLFGIADSPGYIHMQKFSPYYANTNLSVI